MREPSTPSADGDASTPTALAARLKRARERLGVSVRELSRLTGIPAATISAIERGREPRWSTLMRYLETVPGLRAAELLQGPTFKPPVMTPTAWEWFARAHGLEADSTCVTLRLLASGAAELELIVEGLRATTDDVPREDLVGTLLQAACVGDERFAKGLSEPEGATTLELEDGAVRHRFEWTADPVVMRYVRHEALAEPPPRLVHRQAIATRRLTLAIEVPTGQRPPAARLLAWATLRDLESDAASILPYVHAAPYEPRCDRAGDRIAMTVDHVLPDITHALAWQDAESPKAEVLPVGRSETFAPIATKLRDRSGLSQRELARAMDVSHVTLGEAEAGRDPRASTLERYLQALPEAAPQWLLPAREATGTLTLDEAWEWQRALFGVEAARMVVTRKTDADGMARTEVEIQGLRSLEPTRGDVSLVLTRVRGLFASSRTRHESIETDLTDDDEAEVRTRSLELDASMPRVQLLIPGRLSRRGFTLRRVQSSQVHGPETREALLDRLGEETIVRGSKATVPVPARELVFRWTSDPIHPIDEVWPLAYHEAHPPRPFRNAGMLSRVHAGRHDFRIAPSLHEAELRVELPLCGVSYGLCCAIHLGPPWRNERVRGR